MLSKAETGLCLAIIVALLPLCAPVLNAEPVAYGVDFRREADGLPQSRIRAIVQTRDGYIWLGTDGGLMRFNGERFTGFTVQSGDLKDNEVWALQEDNEGSLWIGTYGGGITRLKDGRFRTYTTAGRSAGRRGDRDREGSGRRPLAATPQGLARWTNGSLHRSRRKKDCRTSTRRRSANAPEGALVATRAGNFRFDGARFVPFSCRIRTTVSPSN